MSQSPRRRRKAKVPSDDGRSADAVFLRRRRQELTNHLGGKATATQAGIIDEIAWIELELLHIRTEQPKGRVQSIHAAKLRNALSNNRVRALARLGLKEAPARAPTIHELMSRTPARSAA